ncbi:anaerobic selenocysteine-containing dehydrogenase [Desulfohalotomaculum tongense]|uniref:molybdopterin-containing oxidoreductase family protein n=1 Tax=Desulforadius tongensis TaxID=1216062 RepID=UPI0019588C49|nr:molybdopterin-dependent oxidoreductase [Desulforadius tongensis]MBM7855418.1 anaerobic selenocysteine-containing dehydrogenase [Desulforadius tongensis]
MTIYKSTCPLDCPDTCGMLVHVENEKVVKIEGDPDHPLTRGFLCSKGYRHLQRMYSSQRITHPLVRKNGSWQAIEWSDAYDLIAERLNHIKQQYGSTAVLLHTGSGSGGLLHQLDTRFGNAYGGMTTPRGSICWGSGYAAQEADFGMLQIHPWSDVLNSRLIVLWGRDPDTTNLHMVPFIKKAREKGAKLMVINPLQIKMAEEADLHVRPLPGTDGALALAMAGVIIEENLHNYQFARSCANYHSYCQLVKNFSLQKAEEITAVPAETIRRAALMYAKCKPASILFGYGMQRYANGGNTVRYIDALAALTGNIGIPGGGANYAHQLWHGFFNDLAGKHLAEKERTLATPTLAEEIINAQDPPIKAIIVTRSNPVNQLPNTKKVLQAFKSAGFVVVVDMFMTDTAETADLVLPCTYFLEEENIIISSWNYYLGYVRKVVEPPGQCKPDPVIFSELARHMNLPGFELQTPRQWLEWALKPAAEKYGLTIEKLAQGAIRHPAAPSAAWENGKFKTADGKFQFCSQEYQGVYEPPTEEYPLQLITAHHRAYMHSQYHNLDKNSSQPMPVEINPLEAEKRGLSEGQLAVIKTPRGKLKVKVSITGRVPEKAALIYQGRWLKSGGGVNLLTPDFIPDLGPGTPFYDCHCQIEAL